MSQVAVNDSIDTMAAEEAPSPAAIALVQLALACGGVYVGHTDDLESRVAAHSSGLIQGYTSTCLPIALVWCEHFPTRIEALEMERRIKGWSRAKKLALIRGDWDRIRELAGSNSTTGSV